MRALREICFEFVRQNPQPVAVIRAQRSVCPQAERDPGTASAVAPVFGVTGELQGALAVSGPESGLPRQKQCSTHAASSRGCARRNASLGKKYPSLAAESRTPFNNAVWRTYANCGTDWLTSGLSAMNSDRPVGRIRRDDWAPVHASRMHQLPVRLPPGCDLRLALESLGRDQFQDGAFVLCGIGSLIDPRLRLAGESEEARYEGPFEILTLSGTVTRQGAHLHMSIASSEGHVRGGHVVYGNVVRTTAELLLVQAPEWELLRERDAATGFLELVASRRQVKDKP